MGVRRFEEIQAQTGMSSHLLAARLKRLEEDRIVERRVYNARPLRHEYYATSKGKDLDGVVLALRNWDLRWGGSDGKGAAAAVLTDKRTGKVIDGMWQNPTGEAFTFDNRDTTVSEEWKTEREANVAAYHSSKKSFNAKRARAGTEARSATGRTNQTRAKPAKRAAAKKTPTKTYRKATAG
jgi:DNA-binding HxlR family transcriptional regulator